MRDMLNNKQAVWLGTVTVSGTSPATSDYVDVRGFDACTILVKNNTITDAGTADGYTITLQQSADTTDAAAEAVPADETVDGATIQVTSDSADDSIAGGLGYVGNDRYVGVTVTGTTNSDAEIEVWALLNKPHRAATTFAGTAVSRT